MRNNHSKDNFKKQKTATPTHFFSTDHNSSARLKLTQAHSLDSQSLSATMQTSAAAIPASVASAASVASSKENPRPAASASEPQGAVVPVDPEDVYLKELAPGTPGQPAKKTGGSGQRGQPPKPAGDGQSGQPPMAQCKYQCGPPQPIDELFRSNQKAAWVCRPC
jgi:hypothetical protein